MANLFHEFLYRPLFNTLIFLYQNFSFHDLGIAIILLTILIRFVLFPLFYKGAKDQAIMQRLAPKIKEIQRNHKDNREKQAQAMLELYRLHRVNPFSGFLLLIVQLPILIALYRVFLKGLSVDSFNILYSFVSHPDSLNLFFLGIIDLSTRNIFIIILAVIAQYFQGKLSLAKVKNSDSKSLTAVEKMSRQMVFMGPVLTFVFLYVFNLPSAVGLYWLTTTVFSVVQQIAINKQLGQNAELTK
ncbi:MAG: YidC/Oxa1 family membrane protein insertase [Candidatus Paceibacterota bacterium]